MKIGFDIGGVLSKYPAIFQILLGSFREYCSPQVYIITDQHPIDSVIKTVEENGFGYWFSKENIYCADYEKYGNAAKAILIKQLHIDVFIDDFDGYLQWDSSLGPQPLLLKIQPDMFKPYWHESWKQDGGDFGRRCVQHHTDLITGT